MSCYEVCQWGFYEWAPACSSLPPPPVLWGGLLTWGWEQGAAAAVITAVQAATPRVTRPLHALTPSVTAGELSGPTGICRHRGHGGALGQACAPTLPLRCPERGPEPFLVLLEAPPQPHPLTQGHLLSVALRAR